MLLLLTLGVFAFAVTFIVTPFVRDAFKQLGIVDLPDGHRKIHQHPIPRVGGIAVFFSYLLSLGIVVLLPFAGIQEAVGPSTYSLALRLGLAVVVVFSTGLADDLVGLRPWEKLLGQVFAAVITCHAGILIRSIAGYELSGWISILVTVAWILVCTNAFNLIDGLDGLAAGVGLFATLTTLIAALIHGDLAMAIVIVPLCGCLFGFLRYNFNPASVFLGDCGSLSIGFLLGCFGILWSHKSATLVGITAPLMALSIPLLDAGLAVVRRVIRNQPIFGADRRHIHHRLLDRGLSARQTALLLYATCGVAAVFSLLQDGGHFGGLVIVLFCAATWIGIQHLGYSEFGLVTRVLFKGRTRQLIDTELCLHQLKQDLRKAGNTAACYTLVERAVSDLGFAGMSVSTATFSHSVTFRTGSPLWHAEVPLPDGGYVRVFQDVTHSTSMCLVNTLATVILTNVAARVAEFAAQDDRCNDSCALALTP